MTRPMLVDGASIDANLSCCKTHTAGSTGFINLLLLLLLLSSRALEDPA